MKNTVLKRILGAVCGALLLLSCAACGAQSAQTSEASSTAEVASIPEDSSTPEENLPEETESESISTESVEEAAATPTPAPEGETAEGETHQSVLPAPEIGSEAFRIAFETNPVDAQYAQDMELAASVNGIVDACTTASENWKSQIDSVYAQILERGDAETVKKVKAEQEEWVEKQSDELQRLRNSVSEEDPLAPVSVGQSIMLYYRTRAIDLCAILFEIDGQLVFG